VSTKTNKEALPKVFISRLLQADSPFQALVASAEWEVKAQSLLVFEPVAFAHLPPTDWLFFYSRRGVQFFAAQIGAPLPPLRLAAMGTGTAQALEQQGWQPAFIGAGSPAAVARAFAGQATGQRVVFVQAQNSRQSVQQHLGSLIQSQNLVVYQNRPLTTVHLQPADYLIFTSPLNFETYCQLNPYKPEQRFIAIGATTALAFRAAGIKQYQVATAPTEEALLACLLAWHQEKTT